MSYHGKKTKHERSTLNIAFHKVRIPIEKAVSMSLTLPQLITLFTDNTWQMYTFDMNCNGHGSKNSKFVQVQSTLHIVMWLSTMFEVNSPTPQVFAPVKEVVTEEGKFLKLKWSKGQVKWQGYRKALCTVPLDLTSGSGFATDSFSQLEVSVVTNMEFFIYIPPESWNYLWPRMETILGFQNKMILFQKDFTSKNLGLSCV